MSTGYAGLCARLVSQTINDLSDEQLAQDLREIAFENDLAGHSAECLHEAARRLLAKPAATAIEGHPQSIGIALGAANV